MEARNSNAWRALGKSQAEIMEPTIERWKGGLDAMLVFVCLPLRSILRACSEDRSKIGLFSAIVTAFFVDSLSKLQPDDAAATNGLLANLTNIILLVHGVSFNDTGLPVTVPFEPERNDVRENVFWSISLALNVSQSLAFHSYWLKTLYSYRLLH
jgi:hypothetical protein